MRRAPAVAFAACAGLILAPPAALAVRIAGHVDYVGGPPPGTRTTAANLPVRVEDSKGRVVGRTTTGQHGNFHFRLKPGRYVLVPVYAFPPHTSCGRRLVTVRRKQFFFVTCSVK
jgi:hypothetical protein